MAAEPETGLITDCEMTMAAGEGSTDADNGAKMACRTGPMTAGRRRQHRGQRGGRAGSGRSRSRDLSRSQNPARSQSRNWADAPAPRLRRQPAGLWGRPTAAGRPGPPPGRRARHRHQAPAAAARRARRVHPRRLHHQRARRHSDLPGRAHKADEQQAGRDLRRSVRGLPAADRCTTAKEAGR